VQALSTIVLVVVTAIYVVATWKMMNDARRSRRPYVSLGVSSDHPSKLRLTIANHGDRAALNVRFEVIRELIDRAGKPMTAEESPLTRGVRYLPPGGRIVFEFSLGHDVYGAEPGTNVLEVVTRYSYENRDYSDPVCIDLADFDGVSFSSFRSGHDEITTALKSLQRAISGLKPSGIEQMVRSTSRRQCPSCYELVNNKASKCHHCFAMIEPAAEPAECPD
jgi:hypothetical protein